MSDTSRPDAPAPPDDTASWYLDQALRLANKPIVALYGSEIVRFIDAAPDDMAVAISFWDHEIARFFHTQRNCHNRPWSRNEVEQIAADVRGDRFILTTSMIGMSRWGHVGDGQQRLMGIALAMASMVPTFLFRGMTARMIQLCDGQRRRSDSDHKVVQEKLAVAPLLVAGLVPDEPIRGTYNEDYAIARAMLTSVTDVQRFRPSRLVIDEYLKVHEDAIRWVMAHRSPTKMKHSCLTAPLARAYYTEDHDRLRQFMEIFDTGVVTRPADQAPWQLARHYLNKTGDFSSNCGRIELYRKTEAALRAFLDGRPYGQVREISTEQFPIPRDYDRPTRSLRAG